MPTTRNARISWNLERSLTTSIELSAKCGQITALNFKKTLVCCLLSLSVSPSWAETPGQFKGDVCFLPTSAEYVAYMKGMKSRFYENLANREPPNPVTVKFYLTPDGFIRDARIQKSSSDKDADLICLDAVYSSSPLPPTPDVRAPLMPPPEGSVLPPDYFGSGLYEFTFTPAKPPANKKDYTYLSIPREVLRRYPGLFSEAELQQNWNKQNAKPDSEVLDNARYQWASFYKNKPHATKMEILQRSKLIEAVYLNHEKVSTTMDVFRENKSSESAVKNEVPTDLAAVNAWLAENSKSLTIAENNSLKEKDISFYVSFIGKYQTGAFWLKRGSSATNNFDVLQMIGTKMMPLTQPPNDLPYERGLTITLKDSKLTLSLGSE